MDEENKLKYEEVLYENERYCVKRTLIHTYGVFDNCTKVLKLWVFDFKIAKKICKLLNKDVEKVIADNAK